MNKREFLETAGAASSAAAVLLASGPSPAQTRATGVTVLVAYHSVTGNTEKMAQGVAEGAKSIPGTTVIVKRVAEVVTDDLLSSDAVIVGSPVYFASMSGEAKTFFDNWLLKFEVRREFKMRDKVGAAFVTGGSISLGKETTIQGMHAPMLINQMSIVSAGGTLGASATTGPDSPGINDKESGAARDLGKRVAEFAAITKRGSKT
jgi:NAD(P)H dehydrogenase (quinone)